MRAFARSVGQFALCLCGLIALYCVLRFNNVWIRPPYTPRTILVNPAGTCALTEYNFAGGRFSELDPYRLFIGARGDAFYTVTNLANGRRIRDSLSNPAAIDSISTAQAGSGSNVFFWRRDGLNAGFPENLGPYHAWDNLQECAGTVARTRYANKLCFSDDRSEPCLALRKKL